MLLIVSVLIIGIIASAHMFIVTPTKPQSIQGAATSASVTCTPSPTTGPETLTPIPTVNVEITHVPPQSQQNSDSSFIYPNSNSTEAGVYESSDDPKTITEWYKEKINNENIGVTSFVTTNTNDNIKNVLAFILDHKNMRIEITRSSGDSKTKIRIE